MSRYKRHKVFCPETLIKESLAQRWDRSLTVFVKLKSACSHGGFKSVQQASDRTNIPVQTLYKHLKKLKKNGLIYTKPNGYFKLLTREELQKEYNCQHICSIIFNRNDTLTQIAYILKLKIVEEKSRQQHIHIENRKLFYTNKLSLKSIRKITREYGSVENYINRRLSRTENVELQQNVVFTYKWLANVLNCSKLTVGAVLREGCRRNMIKTSLVVQKGLKMTLDQYRIMVSQSKNLYGGFFWKDGYFYSIIGTKVIGMDYLSEGS